MEGQKYTAKLLTVLVALQLFFGSIPHTPVQMVAWAETCENGLVFNSILGRCLSSEQASQVAQAAQVCESKSTPAEKKACYVAAAEGRMNDAVASGELSGPGKVKGGGISTILVLAGLGASVGFLATKGQCPGATSAYIIAGGSVAVLAGEILAKKQYKSKMKKAQEKLKEINDSSKGTTSSNGATSEVVDATNVQVEAFNALIMQEEAVISASSTKKKLYMLATAAYAAATVMAAMEWIKGPAAQCTSTGQRRAAEARLEKEGVPLDQTTDAQQARLEEASSKVDALYALPLSNSFAVMFANPATRTALAGVLTANNVFMLKKIAKESSKAKERKKFLEELRDQVMAAGNAFSCTSADRSLPSNPNCYCYGTDGKPNPSRNNSQVCAAIFKNNNLAATDYTTGSGEAIPNFCTTSSGSLDETCSCRSTNTCLTLGGLSGNLGASGISLGGIPNTVNSINNGTTNGASLDEGALTAQAARLNNLADAIEKKNPQIANANKQAEQQANALINSASSGLPADSGISSGDTFGEAALAATTPQAALAAIKQDIGRVEAATGSSVSGTRSNDNLDFSGLGGAAAGGARLDEGQLANVMEGALANGNSDINGSSASLFEILTNRFRSSGMRRLFGNDGLPLEKANESDISK